MAAAESNIYPRPYMLRGVSNLYYHQEWSDASSKQRFTQDHHLYLSGHIIDKRLIKYDLNGNFTQELNKSASGASQSGDIYNFGISSNATFLSSRPMFGVLRLVPQPVTIHYSYDWSKYSSSYGYGLALSYGLPLDLVFFRDGKIISLGKAGVASAMQARSRSSDNENNDDNNNNNNNNNSDNNDNNAGARPRKIYSIPLPTLYLSYNAYNYENKFTGRQQSSDYINFRANTSTPNVRYTFDYRYNAIESDASSFKAKRLSFNIYYHDYNKESGETRSLDTYLHHDIINDTSFSRVSSLGRWMKRFGEKMRDSLMANSFLNYVRNDAESSFSGALTGAYIHNRERYSNVIFGAFNPGNDFKSGMSGRITDSLSIRLSRVEHLRLSINGEVNGNVPGYGLVTGYRRAGLITSDILYSYKHSVIDRSSEDRHRLSIKGSSTLFNRFPSSLEGVYELVLKDGRKNSALSLDGNTNWIHSGYIFTARLFFQSVRGDGVPSSWLTTAGASVSRTFYGRLAFTGRINYSRTDRGESSLQLEEMLAWTFRNTYFYITHYMIRTDVGDGSSSSANAIMLGIRKQFRII